MKTKALKKTTRRRKKKKISRKEKNRILDFAIGLVGRKTDLDKEVIEVTSKYIDECIKEERIGFVEEIANRLGVLSDRLYDWEQRGDALIEAKKKKYNQTEQLYCTFSHLIKKVKRLQGFYIQEKGLKSEVNPAFGIFLLKAKHGMSDRQTIEHTGKDGAPLFPNVKVEIINKHREPKKEDKENQDTNEK